MSSPLKCCHLEPPTEFGVQCEEPPEWEIWHGPGFEDSTHSCTKHVGEMLTDSPEHKIYPLEQR